MRVVKNIFFILGIIFGIVGLIGMTFSYFNGFTDSTVFYIICMIVSIVCSWTYIIMLYWGNGYFKKKGKDKNV